MNNLLIVPLEKLGAGDTAIAGGKNASLAKMLNELQTEKVPVPTGYSTTADAYRLFLEHNGFRSMFGEVLRGVNTKKMRQLSRAGKEIRSRLMKGEFPGVFVKEVELCLEKLVALGIKFLAIRSSATAEDLPDASFAGQQESPLGIPLEIGPVLHTIKEVIASLFTDRAIAYREENGYAHDEVAICVTIQRLILPSTAGVMFTTDSETGNPVVITITAVNGLGKMAVDGANADEYVIGKPHKEGLSPTVFIRQKTGQRLKNILSDGTNGHYTMNVPTTAEERSTFCLSQQDLDELARLAFVIENHYGKPMDIEWAKDAEDGKIYVVQAREITVNKKIGKVLEIYHLEQGGRTPILSGISIGRKVVTGRVRVLKDSSPRELAKVRHGDIIVAKMTDPNYLPAMRIAVGIITQEGNRRCHAAIVSREQGKPAIVAVPRALRRLKDGMLVTISCATGGEIYKGEVPFTVEEIEIGNLPALSVDLKVILGDPQEALFAALLPNKGVGLARQEFIINSLIGVHPNACRDFARLPKRLQEKIRQKMAGHSNPVEGYIQTLAGGIGLIARAFHPERTIVRLSDFKTNEYRGLIGGDRYEQLEANPMLGFRGAMRYLDPSFAQAFEMECTALKIVREQFQLTDIDIMVPFIRTLTEGERVIELLRKNGLESSDSLKIGMMCELPSNATQVDEFAQMFDFGSVGSNDLTQCLTGSDRDSGRLDFPDETDPAVKAVISQFIRGWNKAGKPIGICGQAPSDHEGYAEWLHQEGITSISLIADSLPQVWKRLAVPAEAFASA